MLFNIKESISLKIPNFSIGTPINILYENNYLSYLKTNNIVDFNEKNSNSDLQKWIIEKDNNFYYIRSLLKSTNHTQYLGAPNKNRNVYLYTSKNRFTRWSIISTKNDFYTFMYIGDTFNKNDVNIIVAWYRENIDWVIPYSDIATVYSKNNQVNNNLNVISIKNVGREGHTYLYHIVTNYDKLSKKNIFLQGDPFPHNPSILYGVDNFDLISSLQPLGLRYLNNIPPIDFVNKNKTITNYGLEYMVINVDGNLLHSSYTDNGIIQLNKKYRTIYTEPPDCEMTLMNGFLHRSNYFVEKELKNVPFTFCALFSVSDDIIKNKSKDTYINMMNELIRKDSQGGVNGYILERLWMFIFNYCEK